MDIEIIAAGGYDEVGRNMTAAFLTWDSAWTRS